MAGKVEIFGGVANVSVDVTNNGELRTTNGQAVAITSLNAVTANVNGATIDLGSAKANICLFVTATGSPAAGTVTLQVSHDGTNWFTTTTTASVTTSPNVAVLTGGAYRYARAVLSALSGGTSPTVTTTIMSV